MLLVFVSLTGNVRNFVGRVGMDSLELDYSNPLTEVDEDYIVVTPSYDDDLTDVISEFIEYKDNLKHLVGFVGSGNRNFDDEYCFNARDLSNKYNKPLIFKFEFSGTEKDITDFKKEVQKFGVTEINKES
ncbi:class Ib ribonucleoside-diphosphate reductase assembly flavoprotein NrdI [Bacillus sp. FSL W8-0445]|uniref:class Ib ribonucleoside-diphosphate reductase assembly flavoprotein NrdI n=1 Tax=Bacillus TaxID=1386 RepID=UPI00237CE25F|nr:class Ib ribonucleoside-diphosphate reductase assembly flavoprotein NrdI [Bacillus licheniformis]MDE1407111.1 class Ib ribonucleoside-diphosphate reductase assembly flavoprotein NrdI [Bacillus licheniformis]